MGSAVILEQMLRNSGIWHGDGTWANYFEQHEGELERALGVLKRYTQDFDRAHGTGLFAALMAELAQ
jgi:hypothetical protein